ncbi:MAG TPA: helix-turn-helix domain-containing protein, partial [Candidatus Eubacterium avistercoris]|nr:helix-turn-helix domain-containing protein [Candidatus Eubacterium avistercoris]
MEEKISFGKFIMKKRKEKNMTQKELAQKLFVTESAVSKWERGLSYPDISLITSICEALDITEREL